jgi:protein required for attachment to host cells
MVQWYVFANQRSARIFSRVNNQKTLRLIEEKRNPLSGVKHSELLRHKSGVSVKMRGTRGAGHHQTTRKHDINQEVLDQFAKEIAQDINKANLSKRFDTLTLVAEPSMHGSLKKSLSKSSLKLLERCISKDIENETTFQLKQFILKESSNP